MSVLIRAARPDEYPDIGRLTVAAYSASGQLNDRYRPLLLDVAGRAAEGTVLVAVDEHTDRPLGAVTFVLPGSRYSELAGAGEAEFRMLAVDPAAQGRGVGRLLVGECLRRAAAAGCSAVVLCYRDFATVAHRLYTAMGFERIPERDWEPAPGVRLLGMRATVEAFRV
jgi:ribosomal protein S18 acetylase RimI-like enzyme